jgi:GTPase SAR1 family protein
VEKSEITTIIVSDSDYLRQLEIIRKIRDTVKVSDEVNLPQICVIGDQSSGKSSFLSRLTGVSFPTAAKMCTKAAVVVTCNRDDTLAPLQTKYEIEDVDCSGSYVEVKSTAEAIKDAQDRLLRKQSDEKGRAWDDDENMIVSDHSIKLRVSSPDVIDIIIVDLPGIQHRGPMKEPIDALIERNVEKPETLILIVSEAKQDAELTKAIEVAEKYDPNHERTIRVLSKFDNFDTLDTQQRAIGLIRNGLDSPTHLDLGPHAVVSVGGDGKLRVGNKGDLEERQQLVGTYLLPETRAGVNALKERLQPLFASLIKKNLPILKHNVSSILNQTELKLEKIGMEPASSLQIMQRCVSHLQGRVDNLEKAVAEQCILPMKDRVSGAKEEVTFEFVTANFKINSFHCVVFQGQHEFDEAVRKIKALWKPIIDVYVKHTKEVVSESILCLLEDETMKVYGRLISAMQSECELRPVLYLAVHGRVL